MCCSPWGCRELDTAQQPNNNEKGGTGSLGIEAESQGCYITLRTGYTTRDCPPGGYQGPQLPTRIQEASQSPMMHRVQGPAHAPWGSLEAVRSWPTSPQGSASGPGVSVICCPHIPQHPERAPSGASPQCLTPGAPVQSTKTRCQVRARRKPS